MSNATDTSPAAVQVEGLSKYYGRTLALDAVDLEIGSGEYFVLLGPSGGGKTTLLRLIGGFIKPSAGSVRLNGEDVTGLPPEKRPTSMVFQSYALFPHMSVAQNIGYGLKLRKIPADEAADAVRLALEQVSMTGYEQRRPWELSGGQQQRVQLARALVLKPKILLLDEPLAALDAQLRKDMCHELKSLQQSVGITFVHVTHNQEEALTVADQVALVAAGRLVEQGTTRQVYEQPRDRFTAGFIGERSLFDATLTRADDSRPLVDLGFASFSPEPATMNAQLGGGTSRALAVVASVRSESVALHDTTHDTDAASGTGLIRVGATVVEQVYLGLTTRTRLRLENGTSLTVRQVDTRASPLKPGDAVTASWPVAQMMIHAA